MRARQPVDDDHSFATSPKLATEITEHRKRPIRAQHHPRWCDLQQCITGDDGVRHTSTTTRLPTGEQTFELTLIRHDPDGAPELLIEVTDTADPDGLHLLTLPEIKALAETLLIEYLNAAPLVAAANPTRGTTVQASRSRHRP